MTPAFLPDQLVAHRLGRKVTWLRQHRSKLEREGFPRKDPLVGLTPAADLDAWIAKRQRIANPEPAPMGGNTTLSGENLDAL